MILGRVSSGCKICFSWSLLKANFDSSKIVDTVLQPVVKPFVCMQTQLNFSTRQCPVSMWHDVDTLPLPPYSPDLSPIKHVWVMLDQCIHMHQNPPVTLNPLCIRHFWKYGRTSLLAQINM